MAPQTPVQAGTGHRWIEEFPRDRQQIIQGQLQGRPQVHNNAFLGRSQSGLQVMGAMRGVVDSVTLFPLAKGGAGGVIQPGQGAFPKEPLNKSAFRRVKTEVGRFFQSPCRKARVLTHGSPVIVAFLGVSPRCGRITPVMLATPCA